ncbi:prothoracicotropic hormone-like [Pieris rapae]|uniref:prothoracicotropic hormone-like n=1 Tax=Pieris rapae TaxID=64459 RepID=UPI000B92A62A|nr:prothoracicotropic hormone-like [Pieris rapae]
MRNSFLLFEVFAASILLIPFWTVALKKTSNVDEYTMENQRTHMRQNYVLQGSDDNRDDNFGIAYARSYNSDESDELPALIVDYANMIRNDIVLLDNSVETRTRKRGNVKVENYNGDHQTPCSCEQESGDVLILGEDYVPSYIETIKCNTGLCLPPYSCQRRVYNITVLKRKKYGEKSMEELPDDLRKRWIAVKKPVSVACLCTVDIREHY